MSDPVFRFVSSPAALAGSPGDWAVDMLRDGEAALVVDDGGLDAIVAIAHELDLVTVSVVRTESSREAQERTVRDYAGTLALVWVAPTFSAAARSWARARGAMTLLVEAEGALPDDERRRIERFVATLGRQAE